LHSGGEKQCKGSATASSGDGSAAAQRRASPVRRSGGAGMVLMPPLSGAPEQGDEKQGFEGRTLVGGGIGAGKCGIKALFPSPLAGEGVMRSMTDEG